MCTPSPSPRAAICAYLVLRSMPYIQIPEERISRSPVGSPHSAVGFQIKTQDSRIETEPRANARPVITTWSAKNDHVPDTITFSGQKANRERAKAIDTKPGYFRAPSAVLTYWLNGPASTQSLNSPATAEQRHQSPHNPQGLPIKAYDQEWHAHFTTPNVTSVWVTSID